MSTPKLILLLCLFYRFSIAAQPLLPCVLKSDNSPTWNYLGPVNSEAEKANQHFGAITAISVNPQDKNELYIGGMTSGIYHTLDGGKTWTCITDNFVFPIIGVSDIKVDYNKNPHTIMAATGSENSWYDPLNFGIITSLDGGQSWDIPTIHPKNTFVQIRVKELIPTNTQNLWYAYGKKEILKSTDNGKNWHEIIPNSQIAALFNTQNYEFISAFLDADQEQMYLSTRINVEVNSSGHITAESQLCKLSLSASPGITLLTSLVQKAYDHGAVNPSYAIKLAKINHELLLIDRTFIHSSEHALYHLNMTNGQISYFTSPNQKQLAEDIYWRKGIIVNPLNPAILYFGGNIFYQSTDSGRSFRALYGYSFGDNNVTHCDIRNFIISTFSTDGLHDEIYLGTDGGLSYSNNSGQSFTNLNGTSLQLTQFYGLGISPFSSIISAGSQDNSIMSYDPSLQKWHINIRGDGYDVEYSKVLPGEAFGQYNSRAMMRTINDLVPFGHNAFIPPKDIASNKKTIATHRNGNTYFAERMFHILKPQAKQWESYPIPGEHQALSFAVSETNPNIVYLSSFWFKLYKSTDGGKSFQDISTQVKIDDRALADTRIHAICISPYNEKHVWISLGYLSDYTDPCKQGNRILHTRDGGLSWQDASEGLPVYYVSDLCFIDGTDHYLLAATMDGIYIKRGLKSPWTLYGKGFPKCIVPEIAIDYKREKLIACTYGRGLWEIDLQPISYTKPLFLKGKNTWEAPDPAGHLYITRDIKLHKKAKLIINSPLHLSKNKSIQYYKEEQLELGPEGRIIKPQ